MKLNTQTISTALSLLVTFGLMLAVAAIVVVVKETRDTTTLLGNTAHLSQELRQSSDDLTRFIRTFTVTNNQSYWNYFLSVINIRNGAIPLPIDPWRNHWDLFIVDGVAPRGFGAPSSLRARIKDALFTTDEIALLDLAQSRSDALIDLEDVANNAMRGKYRPTNTVGLTAEQANAFSVVGTPNQTLAMELVHGVDYHREKGGIMKPLDDFAAKAAKRVQDRADLVFFISIALAVLVAVLSFISATVAVMTHRYQGRQLEEALHLAETVSRKLATYDTTGARADLEAALALTLSKSAMAKRRAFQESKSTAMGCENANGESGGASVSRVMTDAAEPRVVFADDLEVAEPDADVSSPVLLIANALSTITDNMTLFRPHLPGWLIEQVQMSEAGDDGDEGGESPYDFDATMTASRVAGSHQSHPAADRFNNPSSHSNGATTGVAPTDDTPTTRRSHQTTALAQSPLLSSPTTLTCTTRTSLSTSWQSSIRARGLRPSVAAGGGGAHAGGHAGFKFNATLAGEIHRIVLCQLVFEIHSASNFAEVMHAVSDAVHGAATKTSAAVHGFACDTVMVSWGAARKVVQPDAKAASFMLKVRAALEGNEHVTISAAALSGEARPMLAGRGNQQALSVYALWRPALEAAAAYARATKSLVVGRGVDRDAKYVATIRAVAAIAAPKPQTLQEVRKSCYAPVSLIASGKSGSQSPDVKKKSTVVVEPAATPPGPAPFPGAAGSDDGDDGGETLALRSLNGSGGKDKLMPVPTALGRHRSDRDLTSPVLLEPSTFPATSSADPDSVDEITNTTSAAHEAAMVSHGSVLKSRSAGKNNTMADSGGRSRAVPSTRNASVVMETIKLYEVVSARHDAEDEWLYVVDGKGDSANSVVEKSLERVLEDPSCAVEVLGAMQALPEEVLQAATVQWLLGRLQAITEGQADSIVF